MIYSRLGAWFEGATPLSVAMGSTAFFALIYTLFAIATLFMSRIVGPSIGLGQPLNRRSYKHGQIQSEIKRSFISIIVFGVGVLLPHALIRWGWIAVQAWSLWWVIVLEMMVLVLWNELYFYVVHRCLHSRALQRFHRDHHSSVTPSPWSTYSFHPVEAALLGSVLVLPMGVHPFHPYSLLFLPLFSLFYNSIGHSNYDFLPQANIERWWLNGSRRHALHHRYYHGNYGFMLPWFDHLCRTRLSDHQALDEDEG